MKPEYLEVNIWVLLLHARGQTFYNAPDAHLRIIHARTIYMKTAADRLIHQSFATHELLSTVWESHYVYLRTILHGAEPPWYMQLRLYWRWSDGTAGQREEISLSFMSLSVTCLTHIRGSSACITSIHTASILSVASPCLCLHTLFFNYTKQSSRPLVC